MRRPLAIWRPRTLLLRGTSACPYKARWCFVAVGGRRLAGVGCGCRGVQSNTRFPKKPKLSLRVEVEKIRFAPVMRYVAYIKPAYILIR